MASDMLSFDGVNREVRFVPRYFNDEPANVLVVSWEIGMKAGAVISSGTKLATIKWDDGDQTMMHAPTGANGTVKATNRRIEYESLHRSPAQIALTLT
jgi:hypothetical protein